MEQTWRNEPSPDRPYKSWYGGGYVTAAVFLAEGMCARLAKMKKQDLPDRFWNLAAWKRTYLQQIRFASALLQHYDVKVILAALKRSKKTFSLGNKMVLDPLLEDEQQRFERQKVADAERQQEGPPQPMPVTGEVPSKPREVYNDTPSPLSKLRNLE